MCWEGHHRIHLTAFIVCVLILAIEKSKNTGKAKELPKLHKQLALGNWNEGEGVYG